MNYKETYWVLVNHLLKLELFKMFVEAKLLYYLVKTIDGNNPQIVLTYEYEAISHWHSCNNREQHTSIPRKMNKTL